MGLEPASEDWRAALDRAYGRSRRPVWVWLFEEANFAWINRAGLRFWKVPDLAALRSRDWSREMSAAVRARLADYARRLGAGEHISDLWTLYPKGRPATVVLRCRPWREEGVGFGMLVEVGRTIRVGAPDLVRSVELLRHLETYVALYGADGRPLYVNPALLRALGRTPVELPELFADPEVRSEVEEACRRRSNLRLQARLRLSDGLRWCQVVGNWQRDPASGDPVLFMEISDISELKAKEERLCRLAEYDDLTGTLNRRRFLELCSQAVADSQRYGHPLTVAIIDLDHFKSVNDRHGHATGDAVLVAFAEFCRERLRRNDGFGRLGGEEFALLLRNTPLEAAYRVAERLRGELPSYLARREGIPGPVTVSIGIAAYQSGEPTIEPALRRADRALYAAKAAGRNCVRIALPEPQPS